MSSASFENCIAIVGMSGRFPGAADLEAFWEMLMEGREGIADLTEAERSAWLATLQLAPGTVTIPRRPRLERPTHFDHTFFGYSRAEAAGIDPQHRIFLECAWEAMDSAGIDPATLMGWGGVWAGCDMNSYWLTRKVTPLERLLGAESIQTMNSNDKDYLATRVAYKFNLRGPAISVQSACSTSMIAVQQASMALLSGQCDLALAGGASISFPAARGYAYHEGDVSSPDGTCRPFDSKSAGTLFGDGVGVVVLKRMEDALAAQDPILAVLRGIAANNDGSAKAGFSAPSVTGQAEVIATALAVADIPAESVGYIEAHGTGTALGDPIEVEALRRTYRHAQGLEGRCVLGSVKGNVGHLSNASGIVGLLKVVQILRHDSIPGTLHFQSPNPRLRFEDSNFWVNADPVQWKDAIRRAAISNFGIGGTNVHALLETAPMPPASTQSLGPKAVLLSAPSRAALEATAKRIATFFTKNPSLHLGDVATSLRQRTALPYRLVVTESSLERVSALLDERAPGLRQVALALHAPEACFLFSGQGSQFPGMAASLYTQHPIFRKHMDLCLDRLHLCTGMDLRAALYPSHPSPEHAKQLALPKFAQPALFCIEYAMAHTWWDCGVRPQALVGHSLGELVAAAFAGVFTLDDALAIVSVRGECMGRVQGAMLSVQLSEAALVQILPQNLDLATFNAPDACLVSGPPQAIDDFAAQLLAREIPCSRLHLNVAGHSRLMDPMLGDFRKAFQGIRLQAPSLPLLSNLSGDWLTPSQASDPEYWISHLRNPVRFHENAQKILSKRGPFIEVGPGRSASTLLRQNAPANALPFCIQSLRHPKDEAGDLETFLHAAGQIWTAGLEPHWDSVDPALDGRRIYLPPRCLNSVLCEMPEGNYAEPSTKTAAQGLAKKADLKEWLLAPAWKSSPLLRTHTKESATVLLVGQGPWSDRLAQAMQESGTPFQRANMQEDLKQFITQANPKVALRIVATEGLEDWGDHHQAMEQYIALAQWCGGLLAYDTQRKVELLFPCRGTAPLAPSPTEDLSKSLLRGLVYTANCEAVDIHTRLLECQDLESTAGLSDLVYELLSGRPEERVALAWKARWVPDLSPAHPIAGQAPVAIRSEGTYLITGGFGGIGYTLAQELIQRGARKLVLMGRSPISHHHKALEHLHSLGAEVQAFSLDIADHAAVNAAREAVHHRFGPLHGIIHTAGVSGGQILANLQAKQSRQIFSAKREGIRNLEAWIRQDRPDFVLLCSSLFSLTGGKGLGDYSAANAYLDAWATKFAAETSIPCLSLSWDLWNQVGMAAKLKPAHILSTEIPSSAWMLQEHTLGGRKTLPGTASTDLLLKAAAKWIAGDAELRNLVFLAPASVDQGSLQITMEALPPDQESCMQTEIRISSTTLVKATLAPREPGLHWSLPAWENQHGKPLHYPLRELVNQSGAVSWGPRWECLRELTLEGNFLRARLELDARFEADLDLHMIHPALTDVATALLAYFQKTKSSFVPTGADLVAFWRPLPASFQVELVCNNALADGSLQGNIRFADLEGKSLGIYQGYKLSPTGTLSSQSILSKAPEDQVEGISPAEGRQIFGKVLELFPYSHLGVCIRDFQTLWDYHRGRLQPKDASQEINASDAIFAGWSETQARLGAIWCKHLGLDQVGLHQNFFSLGGHSLLALQIQAEIRRSFSRQIPVSEFFRQPTIGQFASLLEQTSETLVAPLSKAPQQIYHPLSDAQRRLYFLQKLDPSSTRYNNLVALRIAPSDGLPLQIQQALNGLLERQESLRTSFEWIDDEPCQQVLPASACRISLQPLAEGADLVSLTKPFDLSQAPLLRAHFGTDSQGVLLFLEIHHIVADGISMEILGRDLRNSLLGNPQILPEASFLDHLHWKAARTCSTASAQFWKEMMAGDLPALSLPLDHARSQAMSWPGGIHRFEVSKNLALHLKTFTEAQGTTLFMTLLAGFQVFLSRLTGQEDVVVGTPVAGRDHESLSHTVGMFVGTIALRGKASANIPFEQFLTHTKTLTAQAFDHQDYPFETLVQSLGIARDTSRNPLFDAMFVLQEPSAQELAEASGSGITRIPVGIPQAQCDLCLRVVREPTGEIQAQFEYRSDLLDASTMERWAESFLTLLEAALQAPQAPLSTLCIQDSTSRKYLEQWNQTTWPFPDGTILDSFAQTAKNHSAAVAVIYPGGQLTYGELNHQSHQLALYLHNLGVGPDTLVGLCLERGGEMPIALWGILKAKGAYLPIDPHYPVDRMRFLLQDSAAVCVLTQSRFVDKLREANPLMQIIDMETHPFRQSKVEESQIPKPAPADLAYCIYTSGSTGQPKGALLEHGSLVNRIHWMQRFYPIGPGDTILQKTPFTFDVSVWEMFWWGMEGARVAYLKPGGEKDPEAILQAIEAHQVTVLHFVPSMLQAFLEYVEATHSSPRMRGVRQVMVSGEALQISQVKAFHQLLGCHGTKLTNLYGPTEATIDVSSFDCLDENLHTIPIGKPIDNTGLHVVDSWGQQQPIGVPGELWITGVGLARGYLAREELTRERFVTAPWNQSLRAYRTGDLARWRLDGQIEYLGRLDFQIKFHGQRIEIGEIENAIMALAGVREAVVLLTRTDATREFLCAYYTGDTQDPVRTKTTLASSLPEYMIPQIYIHLDTMPLSSSGKLDRKALPAPPDLRSTTGLPLETTEQATIANVWSQVLGTSITTRDASFFDCGGDSIQAIRVVARLRHHNLQCEIADLFHSPRLEDFSRLLVPCEVQAPLLEPFALLEDPEAFSALRTKRPDLEDIAPLTPEQELVLSRNLALRRQGSDVQFMSCNIDGPLDFTRFQEAWQRTMQIHPILRTAFFWRGVPRPVQGLMSTPKVPINLHDWSTHTDSEQENRFLELQGEICSRGFPYQTGPHWSMDLVRVSPDTHKLLWAYQNSLFDGWSAEALQQTFAETYTQLEAGQDPASPVRHFRDYLAWRLKRDPEAGRAFWTTHLQGIPPQPHPLLDGSSEITSVTVALEPSNVKALEDFAHRCKITVATVIQAAWIRCWSSFTEEPNPLTAWVSSGRPASLPGIEGIAGLFTQILPFRAPQTRGLNTESWLHSLQDQLLRARSHEHATLGQLEEWSGISAASLQSVLHWRTLNILPEQESNSQGSLQFSEFAYLGEVQVPLRAYVSLSQGISVRMRYHQSIPTVFPLEAFVQELRRLLTHLPAPLEPIDRWHRSQETMNVH